MACAAALAVLDAMKEDRLAERGARIGERIRARFQKWAERFPQVGDVRGLGGMIALAVLLYLTPYGTNRFGGPSPRSHFCWQGTRPIG